MIDHTGLQVADLSRSKRFYEPVLAALGHVPRRDLGDAAGYGKATPGPFDDPAGEFWLIEGTPVVPRIHIAFRARSRENVDAFHRAALAAGGTDNGAPGSRKSVSRRFAPPMPTRMACVPRVSISFLNMPKRVVVPSAP